MQPEINGDNSVSIEVMALHVQDAFSDETRAQTVLDVVTLRRPDAAVFAEAWHDGRDQLLDDVLDTFTERGYATVHSLYDDDDGRQDRHGIIGIVRNRILTDQVPHVVRLGSRNAVYLPLANPESGVTTDLFGIHLDDRSEARRLGQTDALLGTVVDPDRPTIVAGKFNAMYPSDPRAIVARALRPLARRLPTADPRPDVRPPRLKRIGSLAERTTAMAAGTTMQRFITADFIDADPAHQPTKGPFNLDHILYRGLVTAVGHKKNEILFKDQRTVRAVFDMHS